MQGNGNEIKFWSQGCYPNAGNRTEKRKNMKWNLGFGLGFYELLQI